MRELSKIGSDEELWRRWLTCRWVQSFESGTCSSEDFAAGLVADWELQISAEAFLDEFRNWTADPFPGAEDVVRQVRTLVPTGCLSNTNPLQWEGFYSRWPLLDELDFRFLSFELGLVKPDPEVFEMVAAQLPVPREQVLFLDDNLLNVDAANVAGFRAVHTRGLDEARHALAAAGVWPSDRGG
jgi:HAD superfamily hydrolase (TIGR01509 family)